VEKGGLPWIPSQNILGSCSVFKGLGYSPFVGNVLATVELKGGSVLKATGLKKSFGTTRAVDGVSLSLEPGRILGLLGPNGAGKTTTVSMLSGLLIPDSGEVRVQDRPLRGDADPGKRLMGLVPQEIALYEELSARDNLSLFGSLYGLRGRSLEEAMASSLAFVGLSDKAKDKVKTYSGGMKRRLNLAAGLLHDPPILLLDEPTVGVDPQSRNAIFENLEALKARGKAILYTTHYMEEAERLCDHLVILDHGTVIAEGTLQELERKIPKANRLLLELEKPDGRLNLEEIRALKGVMGADLAENTLTVTVADLASGVPALLQWLDGRGVTCTRLSTERAGLEGIFLALTGTKLRDA
jgi:ABC-2 type transport system ATP-binding protein